MPGVSFDRAAEYYDATRGYPPGVDEQLRDALITQLQIDPQAQIIEPGIGTGRIALPFVRAGYKYTGVDLSQSMMQALRRKLPAHAASQPLQLQLCQGDIMHLPFAKGVFDAAILVHILHLVDDWKMVLDEVWRVLQPGGRIALANDTRLPSDSPAPPDQIWPVWSAVLDELGVPPEQRRSQAVRGLDERFAEHLRSLGAVVERVTLVEYQQEAVTAREVVGNYRDRIFSSCWNLPDSIHEQAAQRLDAWLAMTCAEPDTPYSASARIEAMIVQIPE
jgi:ubiquinone/menaquinone biosynthesis C-methylase UbiE